MHGIMKIDETKASPKYIQLRDILLRYLEEEQYTADQKIPTEDELITRFQVSRVTVRKALQVLVDDGVIYKVQGSGSFFSGKIPDIPGVSYLIGVIAPLVFSYIYPQIIQGIDEIAQEHRYNVVLGGSKINPDRELTCLRQLLEKDIDGLLFEPSSGFRYEADSEIVQFLSSLPIPVVFMNWAIDDPKISTVSLNDVEGGIMATNYLIDAGHRRIACIRPTNHLPGIHRYQGYRKVLETHGIAYDERYDKSSAVLLQGEDHASAYPLMKELIELGDERPTAVFCFNDQIASLAYKAICDAGLKIPDDISVMGFDDSELAIRPEVPLTTVVHPKHLIGKWAAEILFDKIEQKDQSFPRHLLITPSIAVRASVKHL